jgi:hypothetical protein
MPVEVIKEPALGVVLAELGLLVGEMTELMVVRALRLLHLSASCRKT